MADDKTNDQNDPFDAMKGHIAEMRGHLEDAGKSYDKANDTMDSIESKLGEIKGNRLPQRRPIGAGPDAAGNNRSSNSPSRSPLYDNKD